MGTSPMASTWSYTAPDLDDNNQLWADSDHCASQQDKEILDELESYEKC